MNNKNSKFTYPVFDFTFRHGQTHAFLWTTKFQSGQVNPKSYLPSFATNVCGSVCSIVNITHMHTWILNQPCNSYMLLLSLIPHTDIHTHSHTQLSNMILNGRFKKVICPQAHSVHRYCLPKVKLAQRTVFLVFKYCGEGYISAYMS